MDIGVPLGEGISPQISGGSSRLGSVWNRDGPRKSPDAVTMTRKSLSSNLPTMAGEVNKRRAAADFLKECTGLDVPYSNDLSFRQALRDGVILCETLNKVVPDAVKIERGGDAGLANVLAFLGYIGDVLHFPGEAKFSPQDLLSDEFDDRPRIVDCLLLLKKTHCGYEPSPLAYMLRESNDVRAMRDSPRKGQPGIDLVSALSQQQHKQQQEPMAVMPTTGRSYATMQPNAGLAVICNNISQTLMSRLTPAVQPMAKFETHVSSVMEQILNGLTVEYERRLVVKDQELNASKEELKRLEKQMAAMQREVESIAGQVEQQRRREMDQLAEASQARLQQLEEEAAELHAALRDRSQELANAEAALGSMDDLRGQREAALEAQLTEALAVGEELGVLRQRYNALREENKKLYNAVQDLKGSIRVFCRVRPVGTTGDCSPSCLDVGMDGELAVYDKIGERKVYRFDRVFGGDSTQEDVYEDVQALIRSVMDGYNVCIFAYGQTGSGKTHTMTGSQVDHVHMRGINYRALDDLFSLQAQRQGDVSYDITAQMLEIYNETIRDLLTEEQGSGNKLEIKNTLPSGLNIPGATQIPVTNTDDVVAMMQVGARNRHSAETRMNERSSRSHQVLTIIVNGINLNTGARTHACLHLVDLAGSERTDKSGVEGERLREANSINVSLSALGTVMNNLALKMKHIPFRNSKLTELLADSLSGQAKVCMLMHVAPESSSFSETISTLNFGNRVASVTLGQAKCNIESGKVFEAHEALAKKDKLIAELKEQLQAFRDRDMISQRQLMEQAATIQNLRMQLAALGGEAPLLSARSETCRSLSLHLPDSATSTPVSVGRPTRANSVTPRMQGAAQAEQGPSSHPRVPMLPSPAPMGNGLPLPHRMSSIGSLRNGAGRSPGHSYAGDMPTTGNMQSLELDDVRTSAPLLSVRGGRTSQQPQHMAANSNRSSGGGAPLRPALPPHNRSPGDNMPQPRISLPGSVSVSMSARPSSRHSVSSIASSGGASTTSGPATRRSPGPPAVKLQRPATSRAGAVYGSGQNNVSSSTVSISVVLADTSLTARTTKPPVSSRPGSGWK